MCEHQGDGLGVLVTDERQQHAGVDAPHELERRGHEGHRQALEDLVRLVLAHRGVQEFLRDLHAAARDVATGAGGDVELLEHRIHHVRWHRTQLCDLGHDLGDLALLQLPQHPGGTFGAERHEQHCGLLRTGQVGSVDQDAGLEQGSGA